MAIKVKSVSATQDIDGWEFATVFDCVFIVDGDDLAKLFGKQQRVIDSFMQTVTSQQCVKQVSSLEDTVIKLAKNEISSILRQEGKNSNYSSRFKLSSPLEFDQNTDYYEAIISNDKKSILFTVQILAAGEFLENIAQNFLLAILEKSIQ